MKVLFVHQNFPGQFLHLAPALAQRGHDVRALTAQGNQRPSPVPVLRYGFKETPVDAASSRLGRSYTQMSDRGTAVARAAAAMRAKGYVPDVIVGHSGWGETLYLKEIWPEARLIVYAEFYYRGRGADVGFDPEFGASSPESGIRAQARAAHLGQALLHADQGLTPTKWQASVHPPALRPLLRVIHDGIDTARIAPDPSATFALPDGRILRVGDEVLTFVARNLEPYRGIHIFLRALPAILAARPAAQVVVLGGDEVSYGSPAPGGQGWRAHLMATLAGQIDTARVHFMGRVPHERFVALMQVSRAHAYLSYPFVLSWSMLEAMAAGAHVVGSDTPPVAEVIRDGVNGTLVPFLDAAAWSAALTTALAEPERFAPRRVAARQTVIDRYDLQGKSLPRLVTLIEAG